MHMLTPLQNEEIAKLVADQVSAQLQAHFAALPKFNQPDNAGAFDNPMEEDDW